MTAKHSLPGSPEPGAVPESAHGPGLYLHIPFCLQKCPYCSFYSVSGRPDLTGSFAAALGLQIRSVAARRDAREQPPATTIFFGGGTPSMLPPEILAELLQTCRRHFPCADTMEISIEVNPATIDGRGLQLLRQTGFNRLSIGVQSFNDQELKRIGRVHTADEAVQTADMARLAGFTNISLDLMYGLPGQDLQSWQDNLTRALELEPEHLSLYELTIEEDTSFARRLAEGDLHQPPEETILAMMEVSRRLSSDAGLCRYEISNYCRPGYQCRHNSNYWHNGSYIGLGPGAVSRLGPTRYTAAADVERFCKLMKNNEPVWLEQETLDNEYRFRETVIMGLRMTKGVSLDSLRQRFAIDTADYYGPTLERLIGQRLLEIRRQQLRLTEQGLLLANTVMAELV